MFLLYFFRFFFVFSFIAIVSLFVFFGISFSQEGGGAGESIREQNSLSTVDFNEDFSEFIADNEKGGDVFIDFPENFDEKNIFPLAKEQKNKKKIIVKKKKKKKAAKSPSRKRKSSKNSRRISLEEVAKNYYRGNHEKLIKLNFTKNELDMLFFKALSFRALAFKNDNKGYYSTRAKKLLGRIAMKTKNDKLKAKSLLWMSITEWQFPAVGNSFSKRTFPLRYLRKEMIRSRVNNDALLYMAFFYEQEKQFKKAKGYYEQLKQSDASDLVYDVNLKKFVNPDAAANHYLSKLAALFASREKSKDDQNADKKGFERKEIVKAALDKKNQKALDPVKHFVDNSVDKKGGIVAKNEQDFNEIRRKLEAFKNGSFDGKSVDNSAEKEKKNLDVGQGKAGNTATDEKKDEVVEKNDEKELKEERDATDSLSESGKEEDFVEINSEDNAEDRKVEEEFFFE